MRKLWLLGAIVLFACPSGRPPAAIDPAASEPAARGQVFVEREPQREPGKLPAVLSPEVTNLYRCWFRDPYEYMFGYDEGAGTFEFNGRSFGMMRGGINGLLYYGGLAGCASEQTGTADQSWGDPQGLADFAGVSTKNPTSPITQFTPVNPEFVLWARKALLADPEALIDGRRVQDAYDAVFARFFRLMVLSAVALAERSGGVDGIATESRRYLADTGAGQEGLDWLHASYIDLVPAYPDGWDGTTMTAPMAAGFWLRRHADGTIGPCWHGALEVVELYDQFWLAEQRTAHAQAFEQLAALPDHG